MADTYLDDAIDRAVREMMSVDGSSGTTARVVASVERPVRRLALWAGAAAAAAVTLVLAVVVMRAPRQDTSPGLATAPGRGTPHIVAPDERSPARSDSEHASRAAPVAVRRALERPVAGTAPLELPETIPALAPIDPLVVPPPRARNIEPEDVVIPPLTDITEIEFGPLGFPPELRD